MITYLIDGNNLIGKIKSLSRIQKKSRQHSRERLAFKLDNFFRNKKHKVFLHFDGFPGEVINTDSIKIQYSENKTADERIKKQIEQISNRKNIIVVTSDTNLADFSRVCSCTVISSEEFSKEIMKINEADEKQQRIDSMNNEEFKKIFGVE